MFSFGSKLQPGARVARSVTTVPSRGYQNVLTPRILSEMHETLKGDGDCYTLSPSTARFIQLNRPNHLNALNMEMIKYIYPRLKKYEESKTINAIVIAGVGDKAYCAGGDVVNLYKNGMRYMNNKDDVKGYTRVRNFFREEYKLNYLMSTLCTPLITVMNGITMGGGAGIGLHNHYSFATDKTLFAMPETSIGFFPDVGASHFLTRCEDEVGMYLALTGDRIRGADLNHLGLARYFTYANDTYELFNRLSDAHETLNHTRETIQMQNVSLASLPRLSLTPHLECIARCFSQGSVEQIIEALKAETNDVEFARKTLATLERVSPLSLKVTYEQMRRGRTMELGDCLKMEYNIALNMISNPDFYTGVKSVLIDKKRNVRPDWQHKSISDVDEALVAKYFETPAGEKPLDLFNVPVFRGTGWTTIERYPFDENVTEEPALNAHRYPMFDLTPQQKFPTEVVQSAVWAHSRDLFHTRYWTYLLSWDGPLFNVTPEMLNAERDFLTDYCVALEQDALYDKRDSDFDLSNIIELDPDLDTFKTNDPVTDVFNKAIPRIIEKATEVRCAIQRKIALDAIANKNEEEIEEAKYLEERLAELIPKNLKSDESILFGSIITQTALLRQKYPKAAEVVSLIEESAPTLPNMKKNLDPSASEFLTDIIVPLISDPVKYAPIRQELMNYYSELTKSYGLPAKSALGVMCIDLGDENALALNCFDARTLHEINPDNNLAFGDVGDQYLHIINNLNVSEIHNDLFTKYGIDFSPEFLSTNQEEQILLERARYNQQKQNGIATTYDPESTKRLVANNKVIHDDIMAKVEAYEGSPLVAADIRDEAERLMNLQKLVDDRTPLEQTAWELTRHFVDLEEWIDSSAESTVQSISTPENTYPVELYPPSLAHLNKDYSVKFDKSNIPSFIDTKLIDSMNGLSRPEVVDLFSKANLLEKLDYLSSQIFNVTPVNHADPAAEFIHEYHSNKPRYLDFNDRDAVTREFLWYLGLNYEAIESVYPGFDYYLEDTGSQTEEGVALNFDGFTAFDSEDHFNINYTDYARPVVPPKLLQKAKESTQVYHDYIANRGFIKVDAPLVFTPKYTLKK